MSHADHSESLEAVAAAWFLKRREASDAESEAAFLRWLDAAPEHRQAYASIEQSWTALDALPRAGIDSLRESCRSKKPGAQFAARWNRISSHTGFRATALLLLVLTGAALWRMHVLGQPTFTHAYATARGERLQIELPDRSRMQLDAMTTLRVAFYRKRREVQMQDGRAMFEVAPNPAMPFSVTAANTRISVVGTQFAVSHTGGNVGIAVQEGHVRVQSAAHGNDDRPVDLVAGQALDVAANGRVLDLRQISPAAIAPWRNGRLVFDNTPLREALAEFSRYGDTNLRISDPAVAALRISGSFDNARVDAFAQALPGILPVSVKRAAGFSEIVAAAANTP